MGEETPILYIAAGVDFDSAGKATIDWFEQLDRRCWAPSLIVTESSPNRSLRLLEPFAEEIWELPSLMNGRAFPEFILGFIETRSIRLVHIMGSQLGFDLLPDMASLPEPPAVVAELLAEGPGDPGYMRYTPRRYGNLIDVFLVGDEGLKRAISDQQIPPSRIEAISTGETTSRARGKLYTRVLSGRAATSRWRIEAVDEAHSGGSAVLPSPARFPRNPPPKQTVSVGVPCYRHGIHLDACIRSIKLQFLNPERIVIVDDGSDDPETVEALERWESDPAVTVLRQPGNLGPSAARNRALELFDTNYALWIDADDQLLPGALDSMVAKLEASPEDVGFVYPHAKHTGNRSDFVPMPAFNLWLLLQNNICPSPCLYDLRAFTETGVSYPEDLIVGHEDWDIILQLAEHGILGVHADGPTFLYRKQGFSRVHAVDYGPDDFHAAIEARHPALYLNETEIKAAWAPALSIILMSEADTHWTMADLESMTRQGCRDFELLAQEKLGGAARVVEPEETSSESWLQKAIRRARGRWVCLLTPAAAQLLARREFVEQLMRSFLAQDDVAAIVLGAVPDAEGHAFCLLSLEERRSSVPVGIAFERPLGRWIPRIEIAGEDSLLADLITALQGQGIVQWRLSPGGIDPANQVDATDSASDIRLLDLNPVRPSDRSAAATQRLISLHRPSLPTLTPGTVRRWDDLPSWIPPGTQPLARHRQIGGSARIVTNDRNPLPGFELEFELGVSRVFAAPGALRLVHRAGTFELSEAQDELAEGRSLGYVEEQPLPICERLELREMPKNGNRVLVAGREDPLFELAKPLALLGWIVPFPLPPHGNLFEAEPWRAVELRREVDSANGRHRYRIDSPEHETAGVSLGAVLSAPGRDLVALRLRNDGRLASDLARPGRASRDPRKLAQWVGRPPASDDRYWSSATRAKHLIRHWAKRRQSEEGGKTLGWLRREILPGSRPLFSTTHPVTGDQLVTCDPDEAVKLGYLPDGVLGFILATRGNSDSRRRSYTVPWASA